MEQKAFETENILTPQEHIMLGSTPDEGISDPYMPVGVQIGRLRVEDAKRAREEKGHVRSILGFALGLGKQVAVSLEALDDSGKTNTDPRVLGTINPETDKIEEIPNRDLTQELQRKIEEGGISMGLRGEGGRESENTRI